MRSMEAKKSGDVTKSAKISLAAETPGAGECLLKGGYYNDAVSRAVPGIMDIIFTISGIFFLYSFLVGLSGKTIHGVHGARNVLHHLKIFTILPALVGYGCYSQPLFLFTLNFK